MTASAINLQQRNELTYGQDNPSESLFGNRLIDLQILLGVFSLLYRPLYKNIGLFLAEDSRFRLASNFSLRCNSCDFVTAVCSYRKLNKLNEAHSRFVYGLRLNGRGFTAGRNLCDIRNLPLLHSKLAFRLQENKLLSSAATIATNLMNAASREVRTLENSENAVVNCSHSVDSTWLRRRYSLLNGFVSENSVDTGKVLDFETLSQCCRLCKSKLPNKKHHCNHHKVFSVSMKPVGAYRIFERTKNLRVLR
ncbi:hypothetical protein AVEN_33281-1 [Araneus ventricosus]|uniref:Mutator-like transposase domain-containing protein n=1 Tax=Araneus ventricosus TaxID=182803 RepID=A0A4Y2PFB6_ARAVE|nr:hypothetical protein AVEN_33281-1 [Araneus ventricosus]